MFQDPRDASTALLILRHLYDGDLIDWPVPDDAPQLPVFRALESQGLIARWSRIWPLSDRYRLTEAGIGAIEQVYQPATSEQIFQGLVARNLPPSARPDALRAQGLDPRFWPSLHDPYTHWMSWPAEPGPYHRYVWEQERRASPSKPAPRSPGPARPAQRGPRGDQPRPHETYPQTYDPGPSPSYYIGHDRSYDSGSYQGGGASYRGGGGTSGGGGASDSYGEPQLGGAHGRVDTVDLDAGGYGYDAPIGSDLSLAMPQRSQSPRALRVLHIANDGLGAGHVARQLGIARALSRISPIPVSALLATTSEAHALIDAAGVTAVRLPSIGASLRAGLSPSGHRALCASALAGVADGFAPDVLVVDTFPSGPHHELSALLARVPKRALVRRSVRSDRESEPETRLGLDRYQRVIVPDDPVALPLPAALSNVTRVAPITICEPSEALPRAQARSALGLPADGKLLLLSAAGGGDEDARALCEQMAAQASAHGFVPVIAAGPLAALGEARGTRTISQVPLQRYLDAFDAAVAPAGYNTAHELARAKVPALLFARPRPFDDQAGRARRFAETGLAFSLGDDPCAQLEAGLRWAQHATLPEVIARSGAEQAARELLSLVGVAA